MDVPGPRPANGQSEETPGFYVSLLIEVTNYGGAPRDDVTDLQRIHACSPEGTGRGLPDTRTGNAGRRLPQFGDPLHLTVRLGVLARDGLPQICSWRLRKVRYARVLSRVHDPPSCRTHRRRAPLAQGESCTARNHRDRVRLPIFDISCTIAAICPCQIVNFSLLSDPDRRTSPIASTCRSATRSSNSVFPQGHGYRKPRSPHSLE